MVYDVDVFNWQHSKRPSIDDVLSHPSLLVRFFPSRPDNTLTRPLQPPTNDSDRLTRPLQPSANESGRAVREAELEAREQRVKQQQIELEKRAAELDGEMTV